MRYSGQIFPRVPRSAPLAYRLEQEVYALDGFTPGVGTQQEQLQACAIQLHIQDQEHSTNMLLAIVGTAAAVFLLTEVLK